MITWIGDCAGLSLWLTYDCKIVRYHEHPSHPNQRFPSRTCIRLAQLCAPVLFRSVCLKEVDPKRHDSLAQIAPKLGGFIRNLTIVVEEGLDDGYRSLIYEIRSSLPNIRSLTIDHEREDVAKHAPLQQTVAQFAHLEEVILKERSHEIPFDLPYQNVEVAATFFSHFLRSVLTVHGNHIKALHLYTLLPLDQYLYRNIRDSTPRLRMATFAVNIDVILRDDVGDPTPWACSSTGSLDALTLYYCRGVHAGAFARNILRGVYGTHLGNFKLIGCGHTETDIPFIPPSNPVCASIDRLHFDHFSAWELSAMSRIPVRDLSVTQPELPAFVELSNLLAKGLSDADISELGFKGLERLRLSPKLARQDAWKTQDDRAKVAYEELKKVCLRRGIQLSCDAMDQKPCRSIWCGHVG